MTGKTLGILVPILCAIGVSPCLGEEQGPLGLADLPALQAAISGRGEASEPAVPVGFRQLWDHPETYRGRRVIVTGRIVRRFQQGAYGVFPALCEAWIVSPPGNLMCVEFPSETGPKTSNLDDTVRFEGTYLRQIEYQGNEARLAPLIAGPHPPLVITPAPVHSNRADHVFSPWNWTLGVVLAAIVVLVLVRQHLRLPSRRPFREHVPDPEPIFNDQVLRNGAARVEWNEPPE